MDLSGRKKKILAAVVEEYIRTAEPVGSKTVAQTAQLGCSSATIRNELAELASMGYLEQPHTSAGRVPTPQGYRIYVNELMQRQRLSLEETEAINRSLSGKLRNRVGERLASGVVIFACNTAVTEGVAAIWRDVNLQRGNVEVKQAQRIIARLDILQLLLREALFTQQNNAVMVIAHAQFAGGAAHTL